MPKFVMLPTIVEAHQFQGMNEPIPPCVFRRTHDGSPICKTGTEAIDYVLLDKGDWVIPEPGRETVGTVLTNEDFMKQFKPAGQSVFGTGDAAEDIRAFKSQVFGDGESQAPKKSPVNRKVSICPRCGCTKSSMLYNPERTQFRVVCFDMMNCDFQGPIAKSALLAERAWEELPRDPSAPVCEKASSPNNPVGPDSPPPVNMEKTKIDDFGQRAADLINSLSLENLSDTPDFILGDFLASVLKLFSETVRRRADWHGKPVEKRRPVST